jgi:long-subunit fatty acid transport protein
MSMEFKPSIIKVLVLTVIFLGVVSLPAYPEYLQFKPLYTYYNFSFGARALSMSNAFTAAADDLTAVFWNPAGMAEFKGPEAYFNYRRHKMEYDYELEEAISDTSVESYSSDFESSLKDVDFLAVSVPAYFWGMKWNFALSYYRMIPYRVEGKWADRRTTTPGDMGGDTLIDQRTTIAFNGSGGINVLGFSAAYKLNDYFSLGITLQQFLNSGTLEYNVTSDAVHYNQVYTERIEGRNVILGIIFKPLWDVIIGVTYRTKLTNKFHSEYTLQTEGTTGLQEFSSVSRVILPARLSLGVMAKLFKFMRVTADYSIIYWSQGTVSDYYGHSEDLDFPIRDNFTFSQEDDVNYRLGVEFNAPIEKMTFFFRGGIFTEQPLFTDSEDSVLRITGYSLGIGVDVSSKFAIDLAYMRQKGDWTETGRLDSSAAVFTHYRDKIINLGLTFRFGKIGK